MTQLRGEFPESEKIALFKHIHRVLDEHKVFHWIYYGTLLGLIRENRIIPFDADIDLCVYDFESVLKLAPQLENEEYRSILKYNDTKKSSSFLKLRPTSYKTNFHIDIYEIIEGKDYNTKKYALRTNPIAKLARKHHFKKVEYLLSKQKILKIPNTGFTTTKFYDETVVIPKEAERHLRFLYGYGWRIEDRNYKQESAGKYEGCK